MGRAIQEEGEEEDRGTTIYQNKRSGEPDTHTRNRNTAHTKKIRQKNGVSARKEGTDERAFCLSSSETGQVKPKRGREGGGKAARE